MLKKVSLIIILSGFTFFAFFPVLSAQYLNWDDPIHFTEHPDVKSLDLESVGRMLTGTIDNKIRVPLTTLSFAAEYHFFGLNPFVSHFINLLLHILVTILIFFFGMALGLVPLAAFLSALLFGIHPMHVESVAWVTERKDVLYAFFYMLGLVVYLKYVGSGRKVFFLLTVLFGFLSVLSKSMALSFPFILCLCDWFLKRKQGPKEILEKVVVSAWVLPIAFATYLLNTNRIEDFGLKDILTWVWCFVFYLKKFFVSNTFIPLYTLSGPIGFNNFVFASAVIVFLAICAVIILARRHRLIIFAFGFYFLSIFFLLRFVNTQDISIVADRFMYLPSVGFCMVIGVAFSKVLKENKRGKRILWTVLACVFFTTLFIKTYKQALVWKNDRHLWSYVLEHNPNSAVAYASRGVIFYKEKEYKKSIEDFSWAIELWPRYTKSFYNRGRAFVQLKEFDRATADFSQTLILDPKLSDAYAGRGRIYGERGQLDLALKDFNTAVELDPSAENFNNRGYCYRLKGNFVQAEKDYIKALSLDPNLFQAKKNMEELKAIRRH